MIMYVNRCAGMKKASFLQNENKLWQTGFALDKKQKSFCYYNFC